MSDSFPRKAMVFAAGLGTRLRPLTNTTPKPLIEVQGKPLIVHALTLLKQAGVQEVMVNTHYLADQISSFLGDGSQFGLTISLSYEETLLGTGGGLLKARDFFRDEPAFFVMNSDTLLDVHLKEMCLFHDRMPADATLLTHTRVPEFGGVWVDVSSSEIQSFLKAPQDVQNFESVRDMDFCGVSLQTPLIFSYLENAKRDKIDPCLIRDGLVPMLRDRHRLAAFSMSGYFNDVGTLDRLNYARANANIGH